MNRDQESVRVAIDVGGTFTDVAILNESAGTVRFEKVYTTPNDPAIGVLDGFARADAVMLSNGALRAGSMRRVLLLPKRARAHSDLSTGSVDKASGSPATPRAVHHRDRCGHRWAD